jgi:hypothetical protein
MRRVASLAAFGIAAAMLVPAGAMAAPTRTQVLSLVCQGSFEEAARVIDGLPADVRDPLITVARAWLLAVAGDQAKARELLAPLRGTAPPGRLVDACSGADVTRPWPDLLAAIAKTPASVPTLDDPESSGRPIGTPAPPVAPLPAAAKPAPAKGNGAQSSAAPPSATPPAQPGKSGVMASAASGQAPVPNAGPASAPKILETPKITPPTPLPGAPTKASAGGFVQLGVIRTKSSAPIILAAARAALASLPGPERLILEPIRGKDLMRVLVPVDDPVATCRALADRRIACIASPPGKK